MDQNTLYVLDRVFYDREENLLLGDMEWHFEEMKDTVTMDIQRLRDIAGNLVSQERNAGAGFEEEFPLFEVLCYEEGSSVGKPVEVIYPMPEELVPYKAREHYKNTQESFLAEDIQFKELGEDESMKEYFALRAAKNEQVCLFCNAVTDTLPEETVGRIPTIEVSGTKYYGVSWHVGTDRDLYFNLYGDEGKTIGRTEWRMEEFFSEASLDSLKQLAESIPVPVKSVNNEKKAESMPAVTPKTKICHGR